jgi:uroporphyrinogen decarboxylase
VIGLDWRTPLDEGWARIGHHLGVQGNLDPAVLFAPREVVEANALDVLRRAAGRPGHIFNLGHGILPNTPLDNAILVANLVREESARTGDAETVVAATA